MREHPIFDGTQETALCQYRMPIERSRPGNAECHICLGGSTEDAPTVSMGCACRCSAVHLGCIAVWACQQFDIGDEHWEKCTVCRQLFGGAVLSHVLAKLQPVVGTDLSSLMTVSFHATLAQHLTSLGKHISAIAVLRAVADATKTCAMGARNEVIASINLAVALHAEGSVASTQEAVTLLTNMQALLASNPGLWTNEICEAVLHNLAMQEAAAGNYAAAREHEMALIAHLSATGRLDMAAGIQSEQNSAHTHACLGDFDTAIAVYARTCAKQTLLLGSQHADTRLGCTRMMRCCIDAGRAEDAIEPLRRLLAPPPDGATRSVLETAEQLCLLAYALKCTGQHAEMKKTLLQLLAVETRAFGADSAEARVTAAALVSEC